MGENNSRRGYISSILDESGHFDVTKRVEDAIDVRPRAMRHGFAFQISVRSDINLKSISSFDNSVGGKTFR